MNRTRLLLFITNLRFSFAKIALLISIPAGISFGQGYNLQNFSAFSNGHTLAGGDTTTLSNGWFGNGASNGTAINNSSSPLTITNTWACSDGAPPNHSGNILDYSTTLGAGHSGQEIELNWPASGASTVSQGAFWFCSTIPATDSFGTTFDAFAVISGASRLSNFTSNGTSQGWNLEAYNNNGHGAGASSIAYTPGTTVLVVWQYVASGGCSDHTNYTDCVRLRLYSRSGTLLGETDDDSNGGGQAVYQTFGNINAATMSSGHHVQFSDIWTCSIGCSTSEFPTLQNLSLPWQGLITPGRAANWSYAGISGGIPSSSWTQCGSTLSAGSYAGASITSTLAGCGANTYYLLGPGTFSISGQIVFPSGGKVVLRGSGANSTFLVQTGSGATTCAQATTFICLQSSDSTYTTEPPGAIYSWTAGYAQGATQVTLSSVTGISTSTPTLLMMDQCDTGYSGSTCSGTSTDNSQMFVAGNQYMATAIGASADGPDAGGLRPERGQLEIHTAASINGSVVTLAQPLLSPNWASGQTPQVWIVQPVTTAGVENLSLDGSQSGAPAQGIEMFNCYHCWVSGVRFVNWTRDSINIFQGSNNVIQSNYIYNCRGTAPSCYGIRQSASANNLIVNNIIQQVLSPIFMDGSSTGHVIGYNFIVNDQDPYNDLGPAITEHAQNYFDLIEGNITNQFSCDDIHGTCDHITLFRNVFTGWESIPSGPLTSYIQSINDFAFARYTNNIGNVMGTAGVHTSYSGTGANGYIYAMGTGNTEGGGTVIPTDSLTKSTSLFWANYDSVTAATRFCGNSLDTGWGAICASTSEAPSSASTYPGFIPIFGDTSAGQGGMPSSFYYSARPNWWYPNTIPWPAIGPDVSNGSAGVCSGALNTPGQYAGMLALSSAQCTGTSLTANALGGHVNANPAMNCALNLMGMPPDGSGSALAFNANACYAPSSGPPVAPAGITTTVL